MILLEFLLDFLLPAAMAPFALIGAILGAVAGWFLGGWTGVLLGLMAGAAIGFWADEHLEPGRELERKTRLWRLVAAPAGLLLLLIGLLFWRS